MLLESLDSREVFEQYILAGASDTPIETLMLLSKSAAPKVRMRVAENPRTPVEVLESLVYDAHPDVRIALGSNQSVPHHILIALIQDTDPTVRFSLAEDANTPPKVLEHLAEDANPYVVHRVRRTLSELESYSAPEAPVIQLVRDRDNSESEIQSA
jgi:hypothetical protein